MTLLRKTPSFHNLLIEIVEKVLICLHLIKGRAQITEMIHIVMVLLKLLPEIALTSLLNNDGQ